MLRSIGARLDLADVWEMTDSRGKQRARGEDDSDTRRDYDRLLAGPDVRTEIVGPRRLGLQLSRRLHCCC